MIYYNGEPVEDRSTHPGFVPHINSAAKTYELALMPEYEDLMTAKSHLTGKKISRFTHIHQSVDDLIKKVQMLRLISHETASCYQRCVGFDALNALYMTTYEIDEKYGTPYFKRFEEYLKKIQEENFMLVGGMTDPKGDRSKRPSEQADPDLFTRVVEKRSDGVVIRGAKAHQTGAVNSHEIMIMPTQAMGPGDEAYAIVAAIPLNAQGITLIFGRQTNEERKIEERHRRGQLRVRHGRRRGPGRLGRRLRSLGACLHVRRGRFHGHPRGALRHPAPPELRRLQGRRCGHHRGGHGPGGPVPGHARAPPTSRTSSSR